MDNDDHYDKHAKWWARVQAEAEAAIRDGTPPREAELHAARPRFGTIEHRDGTTTPVVFRRRWFRGQYGAVRESDGALARFRPGDRIILEDVPHLREGLVIVTRWQLIPGGCHNCRHCRRRHRLVWAAFVLLWTVVLCAGVAFMYGLAAVLYAFGWSTPGVALVGAVAAIVFAVGASVVAMPVTAVSHRLAETQWRR